MRGMRIEPHTNRARVQIVAQFRDTEESNILDTTPQESLLRAFLHGLVPSGPNRGKEEGYTRIYKRATNDPLGHFLDLPFDCPSYNISIQVSSALDSRKIDLFEISIFPRFETG